MAIDVSESGAIKRRLGLQARLWETRHRYMADRLDGDRLYRDVKTYLINAANAGFLDGGQAGVHQNLKKWKDRQGRQVIAVGNVRNFRRDPSLPHFRRTRDRAWFDFQIIVGQYDAKLEILAYDFELRLEDTRFVRFDLNPPDHENEEPGLRSHMHISSDDDGMSVPAPVMCPLELLDIMVHGLSASGRVRHIGGKPGRGRR